jgi:septal ring factor EnvC (AmiA/AmiB activator)
LFEEILSCFVLLGLSVLAFFSIRGNVFVKGKRTDPTRAELEKVGKHQQDATREAENTRATVNDIRQSTSELADATRTSDTIINECREIIEEIRNRNEMEDSK